MGYENDLPEMGMLWLKATDKAKYPFYGYYFNEIELNSGDATIHDCM